MSFFSEYRWRPGHDTKKITHIKRGNMVLYKGEERKVFGVDRHVYPICLGSGVRVLAEDCTVIKDEL